MKSALSDQVLDWVRKSVGSETEIRSIKRLHGGISSAVHHISLTTGMSSYVNLITMNG